MTTSLSKMTEITFKKYLYTAIPSYAKDNIDAGRWQEEGAIARSREEHERLLPQGIKTKNNHLFEIIENNHGQIVGHIWVAIDEKLNPKSAFIYDIEIYAAFRRKGFAKSVLRSVEEFVIKSDVYSIELHVFNHNEAAKALYTELGYRTVDDKTVNDKVVSCNMQKPLVYCSMPDAAGLSMKQR